MTKEKLTPTQQILLDIKNSIKKINERKEYLNNARLFYENAVRFEENLLDGINSIGEKSVLNLVQRIRGKAFVNFFKTGDPKHSDYQRHELELANIVWEMINGKSIAQFMSLGPNEINNQKSFKKAEKDLKYFLSHFKISYEVKISPDKDKNETMWLHFKM